MCKQRHKTAPLVSTFLFLGIFYELFHVQIYGEMTYSFEHRIDGMIHDAKITHLDIMTHDAKICTICQGDADVVASSASKIWAPS